MDTQAHTLQPESLGHSLDPVTAEAVARLQQFRCNLYVLFLHRADALMELLDALASNTHARSVVELSLNPLFRRGYSSVFDGIAHFFAASRPEKEAQERREHERAILRLIAPFIPAPRQRKFWLFGTDVTYLSRRFARTLADRTFVHQPNAIKGNKPVTIGHDYSVLSYLPEKATAQSPPWIVPLLDRPTDCTPGVQHRNSRSSRRTTDRRADDR